MIYVSIDLETTGLDPDQNQVLEIGAVIQQAGGAQVDDPFHAILHWENLTGSATALAMNARLIKLIADGEGYDPQEAWRMFEQWLGPHLTMGRIVVAGKNFASFDARFIRRAAPHLLQKFHRRVLDPRSFWTRPEDACSPSLAECLERAGLPPHNVHNAFADAMAVRDAIEAWWRYAII